VADRGTSRHVRVLPALGVAAVGIVFALVAAAWVVPDHGHATPRPSLAEVRRQVEALHHKAEQATERYNDARIALQDAERRLSQAQRRAAGQQAQVASLQSIVGAFAAASYRSGGLDHTLQLVFAKDPKQFIDRATALDALSLRQAQALRRTMMARQELHANQLAAAQQLAAVEQARTALAANKAEVQRNLRQAQSLLNSLEAEQRARLMPRASRNGSGRSGASDSGASDSGATYTGPASGRAAAAVRYAYAQLGDPYEWGAAGPNSFDCSGLTMMAWRQAGVSLPHSSSQQYASGRRVARSDLQPGDLVFFYSPISHVGIYIGNGKMIHAPHPGDVVKIDPISYISSYAGAVRP
jgi:cell wall-associated NlpC family hydrolase